MFFINESAHIEIYSKADQWGKYIVRIPKYKARYNENQHKRTNKGNESNNT